jgi:hypothetical protein
MGIAVQPPAIGKLIFATSDMNVSRRHIETPLKANLSIIKLATAVNSRLCRRYKNIKAGC